MRRGSPRPFSGPRQRRLSSPAPRRSPRGCRPGTIGSRCLGHAACLASCRRFLRQVVDGEAARIFGGLQGPRDVPFLEWARAAGGTRAFSFKLGIASYIRAAAANSPFCSSTWAIDWMAKTDSGSPASSASTMRLAPGRSPSQAC